MSVKPIWTVMKEIRHIVLLVCVLAAGCSTTNSTDSAPAAVSFEAPADTTTASTVTEPDNVPQTSSALGNTSNETSTTSPTTEVPAIEHQTPSETDDPFEQLLAGLVSDRVAQERGDWTAPELERVTCAAITDDGSTLELAEASRDSVACYPTHWWTLDQTQLPELDREQIEALGDDYETLLKPDNPNQFFEEFAPQPLDQPAEFYSATVVAEGITTEALATLDPGVEVRPFDSSNYNIGADEIGLTCIPDSPIGDVCSIVAILNVAQVPGSSLAISVFGTDSSGVAQADALAANLQTMLESLVLDNE